MLWSDTIFINKPISYNFQVLQIAYYIFFVFTHATCENSSVFNLKYFISLCRWFLHILPCKRNWSLTKAFLKR